MLRKSWNSGHHRVGNQRLILLMSMPMAALFHQIHALMTNSYLRWIDLSLGSNFQDLTSAVISMTLLLHGSGVMMNLNGSPFMTWKNELFMDQKQTDDPAMCAKISKSLFFLPFINYFFQRQHSIHSSIHSVIWHQDDMREGESGWGSWMNRTTQETEFDSDDEASLEGFASVWGADLKSMTETSGVSVSSMDGWKKALMIFFQYSCRLSPTDLLWGHPNIIRWWSIDIILLEMHEGSRAWNHQEREWFLDFLFLVLFLPPFARVNIIFSQDPFGHHCIGWDGHKNPIQALNSFIPFSIE